MLIRPATPADVPAVLPMVAAICAMHERLDPARYAMLPDVVARYERWLPQRATDPRSVFLVAQPGAPATGSAHSPGSPMTAGAPSTRVALASPNPLPTSISQGIESGDAACAREVDPVAGAPGCVGFLVSSVERNIPIYRLEEFAFIHDVWVEPAYRKQGVARALVVEALARFKAMGVSQVRLETAAGNDAARHLFASCGFRVGTIDMLCEL